MFLGMWAMKLFLLLILSSDTCATLYMLKPMITTLRKEQKITSGTKGMQDNLKMGDR